MDYKDRFSDRVARYLKYRPTYPPTLGQLLALKAGFHSGKIIADIGSGTGFSSLLLLENGCKVLGIEPNAEMRSAAEQLLSHHNHFKSIAATANETGLPTSSVDGILCAQSFHWFEPAAAKSEFQRIARPGARLALVWYDRDEQYPFQKAYGEFIRQFATDYHLVDHQLIQEDDVAAIFAPQQFLKFSLSHAQHLDLDGLIGRTLSCSYMPNEHSSVYVEMLNALEALFSKFEENGMIIFAYSLRIYIGLI
jgi:SAM-dependent methyltransferase